MTRCGPPFGLIALVSFDVSGRSSSLERRARRRRADAGRGTDPRTRGMLLATETMRLRGETRRKQSQPAETDFREAIALAQQKSAKGWELRATMSLAWLWLDQGRAGEARDTRTGLRLVHRRLRYARFDRDEGAAGRADLTGNDE